MMIMLCMVAGYKEIEEKGFRNGIKVGTMEFMEASNGRALDTGGERLRGERRRSDRTIINLLIKVSSKKGRESYYIFFEDALLAFHCCNA